MEELYLAILPIIILLLITFFIMCGDSNHSSSVRQSANRRNMLHKRNGWVSPNTRILHTEWCSFEFGGFPCENTMLFYKEIHGDRKSVFLQVSNEEARMEVFGKILLIEKVNPNANIIKVKVLDKKGF